MTVKDKDAYPEKHPADRKPREEVLNAVKGRLSDGGLACAVAFAIADELGVPPEEVGFTADFLNLPIVKCQLGLFGYPPERSVVKPSASVSPGLKQAILDALVNGRLPCKSAWGIAEKLTLRKMEVSAACETMKMKISSCQLGTF